MNYSMHDQLEQLRKTELPAVAARVRARPVHSVTGMTFKIGLVEWLEKEYPHRSGETSDHDQTAADKQAVKLHYTAQEELAGRIAQSLHDDVSQMLAVVYLELASIARDPDCSKSTTVQIDKVVSHLDGVCDNIRRLSHELRPVALERFGLNAALKYLADGVQKRSSLNVRVSGDVIGLPPEVEITLYRFVQEALANVVRHAVATRVDIRLRVDDRAIHCTLSDNGAGMQFHNRDRGRNGGLGLIGIQERVQSMGGTCTLTSRHNEGLSITVEIPR